MLYSDLLLETAGGGGNFNEVELFLINSKDIAAFPKTWLIFRAAGLVDECFREEMRRGIQPWNAHQADTFWVFNLQRSQLGDFTIEEAKVEWKAYMKFWTSITVNNTAIDIFNSIEKPSQLGVRLNGRCHAGNMIDHLRGFLHPISESIYNDLRQSGYDHIYHNNNSGTDRYYLIFGPITLCSKNALAKDILSESYTQGLMIFQIGCGQVYLDEESWEDGFKYYDGHSLKIAAAEDVREEHNINYFGRDSVELTKTTVIYMIYIQPDKYDRYYNDGDEIFIKN